MILIDASLYCNLNCRYCYNQHLRAFAEPPDLAKIRSTVLELVKRQQSPMVLHGGEPLSWPIHVLEALFAMAEELKLRMSIQTNGTAITDKHVELLKRYNVSVGFSLDGPWPLNRFRGDKTLTELAMKNLLRLRDEGLSIGVITVVSRANGLADTRPQLKEFVLWCHDLGLTGRLNPCISDDPEVALTPSEAKEFYLDLADFMLEHGIHGWSPFQDIVHSLQGKQDVVCIFRPCFPFHTPAGIAVTSRGEISVCHKFHRVVYLNTMAHSPVRQDVLGQTDCKGCEFFGWACYGGCPSAARDNDWRNKDRYCPAWRALFRKFRAILSMLNIPLACKPKECAQTWSTGFHSDGVEHIDGSWRHLDSG